MSLSTGLDRGPRINQRPAFRPRVVGRFLLAALAFYGLCTFAILLVKASSPTDLYVHVTNRSNRQVVCTLDTTFSEFPNGSASFTVDAGEQIRVRGWSGHERSRRLAISLRIHSRGRELLALEADRARSSWMRQDKAVVWVTIDQNGRATLRIEESGAAILD